MEKFVELKKGVGPVNGWYEKCQRDQIPYVVVNKSNKYASVRWDYISFAKDKDYLIAKNQDKYLDDLKRVFSKYSNEKSTYQISGGLVDFENIYNEFANDMAIELYDIVFKIYELN